MAVMIISSVSLPRVLARETVPLVPVVPATTVAAPVASVAPTWPGVRVARPWTQTMATIDLVLTRARRLTEHAWAMGQQWEAESVLATVLGARPDTPSIVLGMRYERLLGTMTYAERDQLLTAVRVCARVPEECYPYMERARAIDRRGAILAPTEFQSTVLAREAHRNLVNKSFQLFVERLPPVWAVEITEIYRRRTGRGLYINLAEVLPLCWENGIHAPGAVKRLWLGVSAEMAAAKSEKWVHVRFEEELRTLSKAARHDVIAALEILTSFAVDLDVSRLRILMVTPHTVRIDKVRFYRLALELPEDLPTNAVRDRMLGALRRATVPTVAVYRQAYLSWVGRLNDDYCRRARHAMAEVERTGQHITHDAFKRRVLDASDAMPHQEVLDRYSAFRAEVFTAEEKECLDAAHLACVGYRDGRCGKAQHEEFTRVVAEREAFAEALAAAVESGTAEPMEADTYEAALMAQGKPTGARSRVAYKGFLTYLDPVTRRQFGAWHAIICRPTTVPVAEFLQRAMTCALEVQERIGRGGAYMSVGDFQLRVMTGSEALEIRGPYYRLRDTLDAAQQALLDAYMLAATGRPPHHRGRHPPPHAQVPIAGLAQRGIEYARALRHADSTVSPTDFYQQLFGTTVPGAELRRLAALVQRQAPRVDQVLLDVALGLATNTLWLDGGIVPIAYLKLHGGNGTRQWHIARGATDHTVTSIPPEYLDAVMDKIRELRV